MFCSLNLKKCSNFHQSLRPSLSRWSTFFAINLVSLYSIIHEVALCGKPKFLGKLCGPFLGYRARYTQERGVSAARRQPGIRRCVLLGLSHRQCWRAQPVLFKISPYTMLVCYFAIHFNRTLPATAVKILLKLYFPNAEQLPRRCRLSTIVLVWKARQGNFICIVHFIHKCNSMCCTVK